MPDPVILAIASAVAGKAAESLTDQARQALAEITRRVRRKFRDRPADLATLAAAQNGPRSDERVVGLASALEHAALEDPAFGKSIHSLWNQIQIEMTTRNEDVANIFTGQADKVVQLRDIHGDLTIS